MCEWNVLYPSKNHHNQAYETGSHPSWNTFLPTGVEGIRANDTTLLEQVELGGGETDV